MCQPVAENLVVVTFAQLFAATWLFQLQGQSVTVLAVSLLQDRPNGTLPVLLRSCHVPSSFRRELKTELFNSAYH